MMKRKAKKFVLTGIGKDQPGIVSKVSEILFRTNCNIEDSTMTILEGEFVMAMILSVPPGNTVARLKRRLVNLEKKLSLIITIRALRDNPIIGPSACYGRAAMISVSGKDRPGIVYEISSYLASIRINITDVNTKVMGTEGGNNVYMLMLEVEVPKAIRDKALMAGFKKLSNRLKLSISYNPLETMTL